MLKYLSIGFKFPKMENFLELKRKDAISCKFSLQKLGLLFRKTRHWWLCFFQERQSVTWCFVQFLCIFSPLMFFVSSRFCKSPWLQYWLVFSPFSWWRWSRFSALSERVVKNSHILTKTNRTEKINMTVECTKKSRTYGPKFFRDMPLHMGKTFCKDECW